MIVDNKKPAVQMQRWTKPELRRLGALDAVNNNPGGVLQRTAAKT